MKATKDTTHFQITGEEGRRLIVLFSDGDEGVSARIVFADEWSKGREVALDRDELELLQTVLSVDAEQMRKAGASLKLSDGDLHFSVRSTNRGEPYRDGFDFNLEQDWEGYPIFIEIDDCRDFARVIGKTITAVGTPSIRT